MTVVIGTAGHIDHGKTSLLRALTGIDADRLPEERRRGMTIDVGYAHLRLDNGSDVDFVDVPGHDRLIGNMLVGAGEIDAALLVVAADDGPRAQTLEHLGLLDALGIADGLAVVTKTDVTSPERTADVLVAVRRLVDGTSLEGIAALAASCSSGDGIEAVRAEVAAVVSRVAARRERAKGPVRLPIDRVFSVRGRGTVVTGTLRGDAPVARGDLLRVEPSGGQVRVREVQVHNATLERMSGGGRLALNVAGADAGSLRRGMVLTAGPGVEPTDRLIVALRVARASEVRHGMAIRLHLGTDQVDGTLDLGRRASTAAADGRISAIVRLDRPVAAAFGDALVLRRPSPGETLAGGVVLDPAPPRGMSRRRSTADRLRTLLEATPGSSAQLAAIVALHGALPASRVAAWNGAFGHADENGVAAGLTRDPTGAVGPVVLATDVATELRDAAVAAVTASRALPAAELRTSLVAELRRRASVDPQAATAVAGALVDDLVRAGSLGRSGDRVVPAGTATGPDPAVLAAMDRLEALLATATPPTLREAVAASRCPPDGVRALETAGRIVRVEDDLAWAAETLRLFQETALRLASAGPLSPAAFRDEIGSSRRYALAILEDLDRRGVLRRTPAGHVPGTRAASLATAEPTTAAAAPTSGSAQ